MFIPLHDDSALKVIRFHYMSAFTIPLHISR
jgi:hypothetical protein